MQTKGQEYSDAGQGYYEQRCRERVLRNPIERTRKLGMKMVLADAPA